MHVIKVEITAKDFDRFIKDHMDDKDKERFKDCEWVPVRIMVTDPLLGIDILAVPAR